MNDGACKTLSNQQRTWIFLTRGIFIPKGARCCSSHIYMKQSNSNSLYQIRANHVNDLVFDANRLNEVFSDFCLLVENLKKFDFDDPYCLSDIDYYNITGLHKGIIYIRIFAC